ncbi:glycosyl transferase family protein [Sphingobacterium faecium NBRC 15299]|uniref:glycosyltransferase n=1 Tax=Sphingobacterium faecium TaxID=34087 RepID=UPI000D3D1F1B|nr:glycosyltransferase [Sphingobacterium faecium]PTX12975.1 GT2 family glycosyltransferase [Sphingobacterium faecium]GEM66069.1 glycosyl transferase family protein [Sphingobacterium faecium NBRC 15299]
MGIRRTFKHLFKNILLIKKLHRKLRIKTDLPLKINRNKLHFPNVEKPVVSIIIPFYNQESYTWACLKSIAEHIPEISFEIILVNDNSKEDFDFELIENIQIINNEENLGFLKSVNKAINFAKGSFIYLLNNDTVVKKGFLDELYKVFKTFANVGAVGSKLLNADGSLQEAGCMLMKDCNISPIRSDEHYYPEVNYIYKVDYCSGCSLLFRKYTDDNQLNLFDEQFSPAYFEETDLCFTLKYIQKKNIYYTPFSQIIHFNGISYNSKKKNEKINKKIIFKKNLDLFKKKWAKEIINIKATNINNRKIEIYDDKSIVFFYHRIPEYDNNSGDLRLTEIITTFKNLGYHITLIAKKNKIDNNYLYYFQRLGVNTFYRYLHADDLSSFYKKIKNDKSICWFYTAKVFIKHHKYANRYFKNTLLVYDMVDIHHLRIKRALESDPTNRKLKKNYFKDLKYETTASIKADIVIAISQDEATYMENFCEKEKIIVISNVHYSKIKLENTTSFEQRLNILFIGSMHQPNVDAVQFMADDIMPIIWESHPEIELNIIGDVNLKINRSHPKIIFHGHVKDITSFFLTNKLMIAPLRYGAGVKGKIGQAFEYHLPVVTSKIGAEGMNLIDNENVLLAESEIDFAEKILQLYTNKMLWQKLQNNSENSLIPFSTDALSIKIKEIEIRAKEKFSSTII